jgi:hypothetical protein
MKLPLSIQTKQTTRLFNGKYKYKIVLVSKAANWFRGANLESIKVNASVTDRKSQPIWAQKLSYEDVDYVKQLVNSMEKAPDFIIRVESPYVNFYTNNVTDIEKLAKIKETSVKYVSYPAPGSESDLDNKKIIVKTLDFAYRVTMGRSKQNYSSFLQWCNNIDRVRLTKRARLQLAKNSSWGGYYFYVKDEKTLTMVKMFVGGNILSVEDCVKQ